MCWGWGGQKKSIVAASRLSQNRRRRSGLKRFKNRLPRHSPTMKWRRRSGSTRPTGAALTVTPRSRSGRLSTWAWSSVRNAQVRDTLTCPPSFCRLLCCLNDARVLDAGINCDKQHTLSTVQTQTELPHSVKPTYLCQGKKDASK